jgi:hypothetical protein
LGAGLKIPTGRAALPRWLASRTWPILAWPILAWPIVTRPIVTGPIVTGPIMARPIMARLLAVARTTSPIAGTTMAGPGITPRALCRRPR